MEPVINEILMEIKGKYDTETYNDISSLLITKLHNYKFEEIKKNEIVAYEMNDSQKWYQMFFIAKKIEGLSDNTLYAYRKDIDKMLSFIQKPINEITTDDLRYYLACYQRNNKAGSVTLDNMRRFLSAFFQWMEDEEHIQRNPMKKIKKFKQDKIEKKAFTVTEIEKLRIEAEKIKNTGKRNIGELKRKRVLALIEFLLSTAARVSEVSGTKISDINFDTGDVKIKGKGNKERIVYLSPRARLRYKEYLAVRKDNSEYAFVSLQKKSKSKDGKLCKGGLENTLKEIGKKAGVENVHPHRFRRTCATNLMKKGMPLEEISKYLGHDSIATTQIYLDIDTDNIKRSCEKYIN